jgi:hypothetical protein
MIAKAQAGTLQTPRFQRGVIHAKFSLSPLENHRYTVTHGICREMRGAHAKTRDAIRLSPLENAEYKGRVVFAGEFAVECG